MNLNHVIASQNELAFGTSGLRGPVVELSAEVCAAVAYAFCKALCGDARQLVVGHDLRPSSPAITQACIAGAEHAGLEVVYVGALPTPAVALYAASLAAPALVITGSHIPFDRNGIKFYTTAGELTKADEPVMLGQAVEGALDVAVLPALPTPDRRAEALYLARYANWPRPAALAGLRVGVYQHSGVARDLLVAVLEAAGAAVMALERTEHFVPIDTEAVSAADVAKAQQWVAEQQLDALVTTDGDGDRAMLADQHGNWLRGDVVGLLTAKQLQAVTVVCPVSCTTAIEAAGKFTRVVRTKIGSPYVIAGMASERTGLVVGFEANGGVLLGAGGDGALAPLATRDALLPIVAVLAASAGRGVAALVAELPQRFTASDRLQLAGRAPMVALMASLAGDSAALGTLLGGEGAVVSSVDTTDGLRVAFAAGDIVHLRPSGNAPELRVYTEAASHVAAATLLASALVRVAERLDAT